jgi:hypothetical protein
MGTPFRGLSILDKIYASTNAEHSKSGRIVYPLFGRYAVRISEEIMTAVRFFVVSQSSVRHIVVCIKVGHDQFLLTISDGRMNLRGVSAEKSPPSEADSRVSSDGPVG